MSGAGESILGGLNPAQRQAVELLGRPVLVIAGAGSGKTRTLVHRVAHVVELGVDPREILLLTFTRRAAAEMLARARQLNPACAAVGGGTFHSLCNRLLRRYAARAGLMPNFTIIDPADAEHLVRGCIDELGLKGGKDERFPKPRTVFGLISASRNLELSLAELIQNREPHLWPLSKEIERVALAYAQAKQRQNQVDYDDLLFMAEALLRDNPDIQDDQRRRWRHVLVDEYQDTNAVQARLLELIRGPEQELMVVGDDAQSIYRFRGARIDNIFEFPERFAGAAVVKLERNYRSTQPILDLTNAIIEGAGQRFDKRLFTELLEGPKPRLERPRDERGQSRLVRERIQKLLADGARPEDIAVLFRAGRDSFDLERELTAEHLAYVKYGGLKFLEASHIKDVLAHLRVIANPLDFVSWQRALMLLPGVGPTTAQQIVAHLALAAGPADFGPRLRACPQGKRSAPVRQLADLMDELSDPAAPPLDKVEAALEYYEPFCREQYEDYPRRLRDLEELPGLARAFGSLEDMLAELVLDPPAAHAEELGGGRITLSTVHSAKGMEWPHVFVIWATDGRLPSSASLGDPDGLEEERRLLYVACTRAAKDLLLVAPRESFNRFDGARDQELSRFLDDLPAAVMESPSGAVFGEAFTRLAAPGAPGEAPVARPVAAPRAVKEPAGPKVGSVAGKMALLQHDRPFPVGGMVSHAKFGRGKVIGYRGDDKIMVHFTGYGLKTLVLKFAGLQPAQ